MQKLRPTTQFLCLAVILMMSTFCQASDWIYQRTVPEKQWFLRYPGPMTTDGSGNLLLADSSTTIWTLAPDWTILRKWGVKGTQPGQFQQISGLAFGSDNLLYVADKFNCTIQIFTADGTYQRGFGQKLSSFPLEQQLPEHFKQIESLAMDRSRNLVYVADSEDRDIKVFTTQGVFVRAIDIGWLLPPLPTFPILKPLSLALSPSGAILYATATLYNPASYDLKYQDQIFLISTTENPEVIDRWGASGSAVGQLLNPQGLSIDASGGLWVSDLGNNRIQRWTSGLAQLSFGETGENPGQFKMALATASGPGNTLYVSDWVNQRVSRFDAGTGKFLGDWGFWALVHGRFKEPYAIAADKQGGCYIIDKQQQVHHFDNAGAYLASWGSFGTGDDKLGTPADMEIDAGGNFYIADQSGNRIKKFNRDGEFINAWPIGVRTFSVWGLGLDGSGNIYTSEAGNEIRVFSPDGQLLKTIPLSPTLAVSDVAVNRFGEIFITDRKGNKVVVVNDQGQVLRQWGGKGTGNGQFNNLYHIGIDGQSRVFVNDVNNQRIQVFDRFGKWLTSFGSKGEEPGQFNVGYSAVDRNGRVFVADFYNSNLQYFRNPQDVQPSKGAPAWLELLLQ
jgi:sugar lactone lactonase YvrE